VTTWFVSRHERAHYWLKHQIKQRHVEVAVDHWLTHLDPAEILPGDVVIGTLPMNVVLDLQQRGARHVALVMDVPEWARGQELSATEMSAFDARLIDVEVRVGNVQTLTSSDVPLPEIDPSRPQVRIAFVSEQLAPLVLAAKHYADRVVHLDLLVSDPMRGRANTLRRQLEGRFPVGIRSVAATDFPALLSEARSVLADLHTRHPEAELVVDLTTGTKPMSLALSQAAAEMRGRGVAARSFYTDTDHECFRWMVPHAEPDSMVSPLTLEELLGLQGRVITRIESDEPVRREQVLARAELTRQVLLPLPERSLGVLHFAASQAATDLKKLGKRESVQSLMARGGKRPIRDDAVLEAALRKIRQAGLAEITVPRELDQPITIRFSDASAATYLSGGWFEDWIWLEMMDLACDRKAFNVHIDASNGNTVENEFDGILVHGHRALVIESKAARLEDQSGHQALYALDSKSKLIAQLHVSRLLVCSRKLNQDMLQRAKQLRISVLAKETDAGKLGVLPPSRLRELIDGWMRTGKLKLDGQLDSPHDIDAAPKAPATAVKKNHQGPRRR